MKRVIATIVALLGVLGAVLAAEAQMNRERIAWNHNGGSQTIAFYDAGSIYQTYRTYYFGTAWRLVGLAGNRALWQEQVNAQNATLWRIDDAGNYVSHVVLAPPSAGFKARSLALASAWVGSCFSPNDDQRYWILWEKDAPGTAIFVQLLNGTGVNATGPYMITKPAAMGARAALALTPIYGNDLAVLFAQDNYRTSIWTIARSTMQFNGTEWLLVANPINRTGGGFFGPSSINAHYDANNDGAMVQILFNDDSQGPFMGRAMVVNVRETTSNAFGRFTLKHEIWTHVSSSGATVFGTGYTQEATAHTIVPPVCP